MVSYGLIALAIRHIFIDFGIISSLLDYLFQYTNSDTPTMIDSVTDDKVALLTEDEVASVMALALARPAVAGFFEGAYADGTYPKRAYATMGASYDTSSPNNSTKALSSTVNSMNFPGSGSASGSGGGNSTENANNSENANSSGTGNDNTGNTNNLEDLRDDVQYSQRIHADDRDNYQSDRELIYKKNTNQYLDQEELERLEYLAQRNIETEQQLNESVRDSAADLHQAIGRQRTAQGGYQSNPTSQRRSADELTKDNAGGSNSKRRRGED